MDKYQKMKPIISNSKMTRAIIDKRKTQTRRIVNQQPHKGHNISYRDLEWVFTYMTPIGECIWVGDGKIKPEYKTGDILYVRHDFWKHEHGSKNNVSIWDEYSRIIRFEDGAEIKDCGIDKDFVGWKHCPSIHMPKWAARLFLRVTNVRVEMVQDMSEEDAIAEGVENGFYDSGNWEPTDDLNCAGHRESFRRLWNELYAAPKPRTVKGEITHYEAYPWAIEDCNCGNGKTWKGLPLYVYENPWVWVTEFEKINRGDL